MDVYYNGNGDPWGHGKQKNKLTKVPVNQTVLWETQEIFIPAVYVGEAGAILDICAKIPSEAMISFLKKWNRTKRLSLKNKEEFEQFELENPGSRDFIADLSIDSAPLTLCMSSSLRWYSADIFQLESAENIVEARAVRKKELFSESASSSRNCPNDKDAETILESYGCERTCCWHFGRLVYQWTENPILSPQKLSLHLQARPHSVTAEHFVIDDSCYDKMPLIIKTSHPVTGQEYTVTLHEYRLSRHSFATIGNKGVAYPEYCQTLRYSITPQTGYELISLEDCAKGDTPRKADEPHQTCGHTSAFAACPILNSCDRLVFSSFYFEPVSTIQWRIVFQVKTREDMELSIPI